jgi:shikimate kinase
VHFTKNLFLIGPMGAGKTTIGRLLAAELGLQFLDTDGEIEQRTGADIAWIFDMEGEEGFRRRETSVLDELSAMDGVLLATGGGCILAEKNRQILRSRGLVVYLQTTVAEQLGRTNRDKKRPLLHVDNPEQVLKDLMLVRAPLYEEVADVTIATDSRHPKAVVKEIVSELKNNFA